MRYHLIGRIKNEYIDLNVKAGHRYRGPVVTIVPNYRYLSEFYLSLLVGRFCIANEFEGIQLLNFDEFDAETARGSLPEDIAEVGGERDFDIPLSVYLPEISRLSIEEYTVPEEEMS